MTDSHYDAFLSYASPDLAFAKESHRRLTAAGFKVWFDKRELDPGVEWHNKIKQGCEASRVVLPVLTPKWQLSEWTKFETYGAEAVIPLIVDGEVDEIFTPPLLRFQGQAVNFRSGDGVWQELFDALRDLLAKPAPDKLERIVDVRYQANPFFVGREQELNQIHERLHQRPATVLTQARAQAVTALGGIGKTTLARQYLEKFWRCYGQLFWIDCRLGLENELARLCTLLRPDTAQMIDVPAKAQIALQTLASDEQRLLIMDNAEDEDQIKRFLPQTGNCRTLITSRFARWSAAIDTIELDVLTPSQAHTLLVTRSGRQSFDLLPADEQASCTKLADQLGHLPLALEQAAAYLAIEGLAFTFADYQRLYESTAETMLAEQTDGSTEYPDSLLTTWNLTTVKLSAGARAIMRLMSFVSPTPLPLAILIEGIEVILQQATDVAATATDVGATAGLPSSAGIQAHSLLDKPAVPPNKPAEPPEVWIRQQVQQLRAYSMASGDGQSLTFHPLVQKVTRIQLAEQHPATLLQSLAWINAAFVGDPNDVRTWPKLEPLADHAIAVAGHADQANIPEPTARLLNDVAQLVNAKAQYAQAEPLMRRALTIDEQSYGANHPNVAIRLNVLALLLKTTNRLAEAEPLMRRALAIDEMSIGTAHPNVARDLINLAALLFSKNRLSEAEPLMRRALAIDQQSYGAEHTNVAIDLNDLAQLLQATNRLAEAEPLMRRALAIDEKSYGAEHPCVALRLNNLSELLRVTNRLAEAEPLMRGALAIDEQSYGAEHPNVATDLNNLALLLAQANRLVEAEPLMRRALAIHETSYGAWHPEVATRLNNLATLLADTNRLEEAELLYRRALAIDERSCGVEHPHFARDLNNLAQLLTATNRLAEAEPLMCRMVEIFVNSSAATGHPHPHMQAAVRNYSRLLQEMGMSEAEIDERLAELT